MGRKSKTVFSTLVNDKDGVCQRYIVDTANKKMWLNYDIEFLRYEYRSPIEPYVIFLPFLILIGAIFFYGRPTWLWGYEEVENPYLVWRKDHRATYFQQTERDRIRNAELLERRNRMKV